MCETCGKLSRGGKQMKFLRGKKDRSEDAEINRQEMGSSWVRERGEGTEGTELEIIRRGSVAPNTPLPGRDRRRRCWMRGTLVGTKKRENIPTPSIEHQKLMKPWKSKKMCRDSNPQKKIRTLTIETTLQIPMTSNNFKCWFS